MGTITPFYLDWGFWQGAAAIIALIVSLTPPIRRLLRGPKLEIEHHDLIPITHTLGNPNVSLFLLLRNTGGVSLRIKSINLRFKPREGEAFQVNGQSFFPLLTEEKQVIFAPFKLKVEEDWAHTVYFYNRFSRHDDSLHREIAANLRNDLIAKKTADPNSEPLANKENVQPAIQFFERKFKWNTGEYDVDIDVVTEGKLGTVTKKCRMTIYEADSHQLRSYTKDYTAGLGVVFFDLNRHPYVTPSLDPR